MQAEVSSAEAPPKAPPKMHGGREEQLQTPLRNNDELPQAARRGCGAAETLCPVGACAHPQPRGTPGAALPPLPCVPAPSQAAQHGDGGSRGARGC